MKQLSELFDYKNQIVQDILKTPEILKLIDENVAIDEAGKLVYNRVFPCYYLPDTVEEGTVYICVEVDIDKVINTTFLSPVVSIWVIAHKSILRLEEGGVRVDAICSEICNILNGSTKYGMGELEFQSVRRFTPLSDYPGRVMTFRTKDWNKPFTPKLSGQANRRKSY